MIKSLFEEDEKLEKAEEKMLVEDGEKGISVENETSKNEVVKSESDIISTTADVETSEEIETIEEIKSAIENPSAEPINPNINKIKPFEIDHPIGQPNFEQKSEVEIKNEPIIQKDEESSRTVELEKKLREIEEELKLEKELEAERERQNQAKGEQKIESRTPENLLFPQDNFEQTPLENIHKTSEQDEQVNIKPKETDLLSTAQSVRNMGMAWSAGIALFAGVVVMLIIGWFVDLILPTSPWGKVVGIILGAIIGFIQFFRITSNIINPKPNDFDKVSLRNNLENVEEKSEESQEVKTDDLADENNQNQEQSLEPKISEESKEVIVENLPIETKQEMSEFSENMHDEADEILEIPTDESKV